MLAPTPPAYPKLVLCHGHNPLSHRSDEPLSWSRRLAWPRSTHSQPRISGRTGMPWKVDLSQSILLTLPTTVRTSSIAVGAWQWLPRHIATLIVARMLRQRSSISAWRGSAPATSRDSRPRERHSGTDFGFFFKVIVSFGHGAGCIA